MTKRTILVRLCAAILVIAALAVPALAATPSIQEQMAQNSAAWIIANNDGDTATCNQLHAANEQLAAMLAGNGGTASYNAAAGTWSISDAAGNVTSSASAGLAGKDAGIVYTTVGANGSIAALQARAYMEAAIAAYLAAGGTTTGLANSYNYAAAQVAATNNYEGLNVNSAAQEVAVAKTLLGLTDAQAKELQTGLETQKAAYNSAKTQYDAAVKMGNTALAESAKAKMDAAHEAAQDLRAKYNYTGDTTALTDGGSYDGGTGGSSGAINNGSFFYVNLVQQYTITASAGSGGSISPSGNVVLVRGSDRKFTFTPNAGYEVKSVTVDGKAVEKADSYTFKNVTAAHSISVEFQKKGCTITASAGTGGTISPSGTTTVEYGGKQKYSVSASTGYKIEDVKIDGKSEGKVSTYTFSNVTSAHTISATFVKKTYAITASAGTGGSISPSGSTNVTHGGSQKYTITPSTGYEIADVKVDGKSVGKVSTYTFSNVTGKHSISVEFQQKGYAITASAGTGGSISPSGSTNVTHGGSQKYTITPATGYEISDVKVDGKSVGKVSSYTFSNVTGTHTIATTFQKKTYAISASAGTGGSISPSGSTNVTHGGSQKYTITPSTGYEIADVKVDGKSVGKVSAYTFSNVTGTHTIAATFQKKTYAITASAGTGGSISPSGSTSIQHGGSQKYTITPSAGYEIADVKVDGKSVGKVSTYTFSNVTTAHTISATFVKKTYAIIASAGTGGSISPSGSTNVTHGGSQKYTITPGAGYEIADVKVDGKSVGKVNSYTFSNVTGTHSIAVSFRLKPIADLGSITVTDTLGAALNGKATKSGYGICVSVPVTLENVTDVTVTLSYNFGAGKKTVTLTEVGGKYVLPVNPVSVSNARCVYIPVETPDGSYTLTASVSARDADGNTVTDSATAVVTVLGSMYEDDFTADS